MVNERDFHCCSRWQEQRGKTGVGEVLGRPATNFSEYIQKVIASGAWSRHSAQ